MLQGKDLLEGYDKIIFEVKVLYNENIICRELKGKDPLEGYDEIILK
jgi:hypothetical protein